MDNDSIEEFEAMPVDAFIHELATIRASAARAILAGSFGKPPLAGTPDVEASKRPEITFLIQLGVYPEWRETHLLARQIQESTTTACCAELDNR